MKNSYLLKAFAVVVVALIFAVGFYSDARGAEQQAFRVLRESDNGKVVALIPNKEFEIILPSNPTTGYDWQVAAGHDKGQATFVSKRFLQASNGDNKMLGVSGYTILKFRPGIEGWLELPLIYKRSWEKDSKTDQRFTIQMVVTKSELLDETDNNKLIHVESGGEFIVVLPANPTTGYDWQLAEKMNDSGITIKSQAFISSNNDENMSGVPGRTLMFFEAKNVGVIDLELKYKRVWETEKSDDKTFNLRVIITGKNDKC